MKNRVNEQSYSNEMAKAEFKEISNLFEDIAAPASNALLSKDAALLQNRAILTRRKRTLQAKNNHAPSVLHRVPAAKDIPNLPIALQNRVPKRIRNDDFVGCIKK